MAVDSEQYGTAAAVAAEAARTRRADPSLAAADDLAAAVAGEEFGAAAAAAARLRQAVTVAPASVTTPPGVVVADGGGQGGGGGVGVAPAAAAAATTATTTPATDGWGEGHLTNRLLTLSPADGDGRMRLATVAPDGSNGLSLELEAGGGLLLQPTWSPDGAYVAVADVRLPLSGSRREGVGTLAAAAAYVVILSAVDGAEVRRVRVSPPPFYFQWSADGSLLTFLHNEPALPSPAGAGGGGLPSSSPPRRSRRVRASVVSAAPGADSDAVPFAGGHPLFYAMSPEGGTALVYAGDYRRVAVYDLAAGPGGGGGGGSAPPSRVLSTSSGALATPQWLPRPHRQTTGGSAAEAAGRAPAAADAEPLVLLLEDEAPANAGVGGGGSSDTFSAGSPPQALVLMSSTSPSRRRVLGRFWGHVRYAVAPGGSRLAVLVTNPLSGREELSVIEGPFALDPPGPAGGGAGAHGGRGGGAATPADAILSNPANRAVAFFWSPDGRRLLFLTTPRGSAGGGGGGGGMGGTPRNALYAWAVYDAVTGRVARFARHRLPTVGPLLLSFFDQHARSTTFWAPDSASFVYAAIPVEEGEAAAGEAAYAGGAPPPPAGAVSDAEARWLRGGASGGGASAAAGGGAPLPPMRSAAAPSAFVQTLPAALTDASLPRAGLADAVEPPRRVADDVQYASWSPC